MIYEAINLWIVQGFDIAHQGTIYDATFSPSENRIASCGGDHLIKVRIISEAHISYLVAGHAILVCIFLSGIALFVDSYGILATARLCADWSDIAMRSRP
jgi:hypothetical protein